MKKISFIIVTAIMLVVAVTLIFSYLKPNEVAKEVDEKSTVNSELKSISPDGAAYTEISTYDENLNPLADTAKIKPKDNQANILNFNIFNGVDYYRDFKIIVLQNFVQSKFSIDDNSNILQSHNVRISKNSERKIKVSVEIDKNTVDLTVLFVKEPDRIVKDMDIEKLAYYEPVYAKRLLIDNESNNLEIKNIIYPDFTYQSDVDDTPIFLSESKIERKILPSAQQASKAYLHIGNPNPELTHTKYAIIALKDWEQVKLMDDSVLFVESDSNKTNVYNIELPRIENNEENIQFIAFPYPFEDWYKYTQNPVEYTFRTALLKDR
ncbi:hypothetical protein [Bacillus tropicus]|uniref:hypothetical protein n=1 Tax=Bacillus tropicus TaxID=2026188 RepID=UPI0023AF1511|nr:hypothetical protein [Bacillus tropicus]MDE7552275.1 hypothetical protein [Bacillus tropicus]MDE7573750.1 hypothetical protein [Bacillus tropicus]